MTIRAIIFDFGDVLDTLEDQDPWLAQREAAAARLGMTGESLWNYLYSNPLWEQVKRGQIPNSVYWDGILRPHGITDPAAQAAYVAELFKDRARLHPQMLALLRDLRPRYQLAMLSNTFRLELERYLIETHGLGGIFDVVVGSADVGMAKPEPEIYRLTLDRLGVKPEEVLFIDDMPRNTAAAEALGITSIVFETPEQLRRELVQRGLLP
ncbi:MAG TPA: HAD family phosphatase [Aggregatilineales bacterium]|nr:HAD family phosphatase [Aggregatilineales bacterium]